MTTLSDTPRSASFADGTVEIILESGAKLRFRAAENPRLASGTFEQLNNIEVSPFGVHWPELDEDLSIRGIIEGDYGQRKSPTDNPTAIVAEASPDDPETSVLKLLTNLQTELEEALNSLGGKTPKAIGDRYHLHAAAYVNKAVEGYWLLRTQGRIDASKLLVRPAIEAILRIEALRKDPALLIDIAWTEKLEDQKWLQPVAQKHGTPYDDHATQKAWERFESAYKAEFPNTSSKGQKLSLYSAAQAAGLSDYYDSHYRMYCQYAHAALRATGGYLDELTDPEDTRTMVLCAYC